MVLKVLQEFLLRPNILQWVLLRNYYHMTEKVWDPNCAFVFALQLGMYRINYAREYISVKQRNTFLPKKKKRVHRNSHNLC